jgi:hypothetical protein
MGRGGGNDAAPLLHHGIKRSRARGRQREIASSRRFVVRGPIDAITIMTATIALAINRKTPVVP